MNGAYDSFGNYYALPEWVVSDPQNIVEHGRSKDDLGSGDDETQGNGDDGEMTKEEKGKEVVDESKQIQVRARLSETGNDITVYVPKTDMVRSVIKKMATEAEVRLVRLPVTEQRSIKSFSCPHRKRYDSPIWARCSRRMQPSGPKVGKMAIL